MALDPQAQAQGASFLKRNPLFSSLGDETLAPLVEALKSVALGQGVTLLREGEPSDGLYLIKSGRVRITNQTSNGQKTVAFLGRGDTIGELSLLTGEAQAFNVLLDTACEFLMLSKTDFDALLERYPLVGIHITRALSRRLAVSFHPPADKPKEPQMFVLVPGLPHEATVLSTINLAIALVEQTRRKVILLDLSPRSGDMARALGLNPPLSNEAMFAEEDLLDFSVLQGLITPHPSGLELLSLPPRLFKDSMLSVIPPLMSLLKEHFDFVLVLPPTEKDPLSEAMLQEASKVYLVLWDRAPELAAATQSTLQDNLGKSGTPVATIYLEEPSRLGTQAADFRIPWTEALHQTFRDSGSPYLNTGPANQAIKAFDRVARAMGKLRIGLAMGSGAAYGYTLVGLLKVFEREGIPIDMVAGTSMGALLGSFFCAGKTPEEIREISRTITKTWLFENIIGDITFPHSGFLAGQTLSGFLRSILGTVEFHQLPIPFAAVATDIRSGHEVVLKEGRVADAVRASTSIPILFRPFLHRGRFLVDGGLVNPVPTSTVANMGADILISVNLTAKPSVRRGLGRYRSSFPLAPRSPRMTEVFFKMLYTMQYEIAQARTEIAHVVIAPDMKEFLWTDFHRSEEILKFGEVAAEEAVPKIKSLLPFFSDFCKVPLGISLRAY